MLSLSPIVQVNVNISTPVIAGTAFSTGLILAPTSATLTEDQQLQLFTSAADMRTAGFQATDPAYLAAVAYFAASPAPDRVYVAQYANNSSAEAAYQNVMNRTDDFYGVFLCESTAAKISAFLEAFVSSPGRNVLFLSATGSVSSAIAASGIIKKAYNTGSSRVLTVYGSDMYAGAALMGTAMGLSRVYEKAFFALCYQQVPGMLPAALTEGEISSIKGLNGNVYITRGVSRNLLENGSVVSGRRFDEVLALDRIAADLQEAAVALLTAGSGRLPQTDETSAVFINRFSAVLSEYAAAGTLATGPWRGRSVGRLSPGDVIENGFLMWAESYDIQSDEDRAARKAMPIHVALCLSGSVETLLIDVDVSV